MKNAVKCFDLFAHRVSQVLRRKSNKKKETLMGQNQCAHAAPLKMQLFLVFFFISFHQHCVNHQFRSHSTRSNVERDTYK